MTDLVLRDCPIFKHGKHRKHFAGIPENVFRLSPISFLIKEYSKIFKEKTNTTTKSARCVAQLFEIAMKTFGKCLSLLREQREMSQRDLATRAQITVAYLEKVERGYAPPPSAQTICALAKSLSADEDELFALSGKLSPSIERALICSPELVALVREAMQGGGYSRDFSDERRCVREPITAVTKKAVFALDNFECVYCSAQAILEVDHIHPHSLGGTDEPENLVTCCHRCNKKKSGRIVKWPMVFGRFREDF